MTSHQTTTRRLPPAPTAPPPPTTNGLVECPLASLGRNTNAVLDTLNGGHHQSSYHHPLSSSPLDPQVYQMSRKSPDLSTDVDDIIYTTSVSQQGDTVDGLMNDLNGVVVDSISTSATVHQQQQQQQQRSRTARSRLPDLYQMSHSSSQSSLERALPVQRKAATFELRGRHHLSNGGTRSAQYFLEKKMDALYLNSHHARTLTNGTRDENGGNDATSQYHQNERFYLEDGLRNMCVAAYANGNGNERLTDPHRHQHHRASSPSETSGSDRYLLNRTNSPVNAFSSSNHFSSSNNNTSSSNLALDQHQQRSHQHQHHFPHTKVKSLSDGLCNLGRFSPSLDQGYATLVTPSPTGAHHPPSTAITTHSIVHHANTTSTTSTLNASTRRHASSTVDAGPPPWRKKGPVHAGPYFDRLPDEAVLNIFSWLDSCELCNVARVCRRFQQLAWRPVLWKFITLRGEHISGDRALKMIFRQLCGQSRNGSCPDVERVMLYDGCRMSDKGLQLLTRRCPELTHLQLQFCVNITNQALVDVLTKCTNLRHLDVMGCSQVTSINPNPLVPSRHLLLQYLDLTDCMALDDIGLKIAVHNCPQLVYLYLRRCIHITDAGIEHVPSYCLGLKELSVSDCINITDFGLYELAKLGSALRYLSVAKCDRVSDAGLKVIARYCYKLRYLNARGCEAVSDDSITVLASSCPRLRALDIGKCDVSDAGLRALAESCPNLKKLSLRNCDMITDRGVQCIAYYCRGLQQLNIQDCQISIEGYRAVKKYCKRCIIEHTNPGFC